MKNFILPFSVIFLLTGCAATRETGAGFKTDARVYQLLEKANRHSSAANLQKLDEAYYLLKQQYLNSINELSKNKDESNLEEIIAGYQSLQNLYDSISPAQCCGKLPGLVNFRDKLDEVKLAAAASFYDKGSLLLNDTSAESIRLAYIDFEKAVKYVPDYKDANEKKNELYRSNVFIVAFSPVEDTLFFTEKGFAPKFYTYCNNLFVDQMLDEMSRQRAPVPFLKLMTMNDCITQHVDPDWFINISLPEMSSFVQTETKTKSATEQVPIGTDTSGRTIYRSEVVYKDYVYDVVSAAAVDLQVDVTDLQKKETIYTKHFTASYAPNTGTFSAYDNSLGTLSEFPLRERVMRSLLLRIIREYKSSIAHMLGN